MGVSWPLSLVNHLSARRTGLLGLLTLGFFTLFVLPLRPAAAANLRFLLGGVAAVGPNAQPVSVSARLQDLNLTWYYDYSYQLDDEQPGTHKVAVLRGGETNRAPLDRVADQARRHPGHYWIVFNEPDLEGQDMVSDQFLAARGQKRFDYYAQTYHEYAVTLKQADPTAKLVAPNLFSPTGDPRPWLDGFRSAYKALYGTEPPVDVWGLHLYPFDPKWQTLPVLNIDYSKKLYATFRDYVHAIPGQANAPIWVTEAGTIWAYKDIYQGSDSLFRGNVYAWPEVTAYLADLIPWLEAQGVGRWFLFGTNPAPDPWAGVPNALYLLDNGGQPTEAGQLLSNRLMAAQLH